MSMKAYAVQEDYEGTGAIIFAKHAIQARRWGANEFNGGELGGMTCRRAPWADQYAPGPIPAEVMMEHGWSFLCVRCERRVLDLQEAVIAKDNVYCLDCAPKIIPPT